MRHILVDYARAKQSRKRGGAAAHQITLDENSTVLKDTSGEIVALNEALENLGNFSNLFSQNIKSGSSKQLTNFSTDKIFAFAVSQDEKRIAFIRGSEINEAVIIRNFR